MTTAEFDRWIDDLCGRFPSIDGWLAKHAQDEASKRRTLRNWCIALQDVPLAEALEVNALMQSGDRPWVGEYESDKERLPRHVRHLCKQLAADRRPPDNRDQFAPATSKSGGFPAKQILLRLWELVRNGTPPDEAREIALREFPVGTSPFREPRYNCATCLDTGRVLVASNEAIIAMLLSKFAGCRHRDGSMKCHCRGHEAANPKRPIVIYDSAQDFKIDDPLWRPAEVQRFAEWVEWQREHRAEAVLKSRENYEAGFERFNQREFA